MKTKIFIGVGLLFIWWLFIGPYLRSNPIEFNANGPSLKSIAYSDPLGAIVALHTMHDMQMQVNRLKLTGQKYEKFRHIYFSAKLTSIIGSHRTQAFTDAYERFKPNQTVFRNKDLEYNKRGRELGHNLTNVSDEQLTNYVLKEL